MGATRKGPRRKGRRVLTVRSDGRASLPVFRTARGAGQARTRTGWVARLGAAALPGSYRLVTYLRASGSRGPRGAAGDGWAICVGSQDLGTSTAGPPPIVRSPMCEFFKNQPGFTTPQTAPLAATARMDPGLSDRLGRARAPFHTSPSNNTGERLGGACHATLKPQCSPTVRPLPVRGIPDRCARSCADAAVETLLLARRHVRAKRRLIQCTTFYSPPSSLSASPPDSLLGLLGTLCPPPSQSVNGHPRQRLWRMSMTVTGRSRSVPLSTILLGWMTADKPFSSTPRHF